MTVVSNALICAKGDTLKSNFMRLRQSTLSIPRIESTFLKTFKNTTNYSVVIEIIILESFFSRTTRFQKFEKYDMPQ